MQCPLCDVISQIKDNPSFITELSESYVMLGENQGCPGWCVLILKTHVEHMDEMQTSRQLRLFEDVAIVAGVIRNVFATDGADGGPVRINYECLGNQVGHVHWHLIPRHADDPTPRAAVWGWDAATLRGTLTKEERAELVTILRKEIR